jgi:hypothetical protein
MTDFHFIRPFWLLAVIALMMAIAMLKKMRIAQSAHRPAILVTIPRFSRRAVKT